MTQRFGKWPKYLGNGLDTWGTAEVFENRLKLSWKWLKNLTKGLNMWKMTYIFGNWLKCLRNDQNMWEMTQICGKSAQIYVGK